MLQLKKITKKYKIGDTSVDALKGINLEFRKSEFVAILGPSGCGKTTLLNIIGGLDRYTQGDLLVEGISTKEYKDVDWDIYRNNSIGFIFQSYNLIPHQTVLSNVELAMTLAGVSNEERKKRAIEALEKVGLGDQIKKKPSQMSGGQMQRVAIARALVNNPDILLADEPTGALDSETSLQIMKILKEIAKDRLIIMVTHNPDLADEYATRTITLSDGLVTGDSKPYKSENITAKFKGKRKKISMSFLTALSLSFSNLLTKKGRTIMTAFAGSIGIIGIALILSLANGVNNYIQNVEEDMLSIYPLSIQNQGMDITSMLIGAGADPKDNGSKKDENSSSKGEKDKQTIEEAAMISNMFSRVGTNDLESLKEYFESGDSEIKSKVNAIQYSYNITPQVFSENKSKEMERINPNDSFSPLGFGSNKSSSSLLNMSTSSDNFFELADDSDLFKTQYDVVAGKWPENYNECLLVLTHNGQIPDLVLYQLGFRDSKELDKMLNQFANGKNVDTPSDTINVKTEDIMAKNLKLVLNADYYKYDPKIKRWKDMSKNQDYMDKVISKGETLKISGIVKPSGNSKTTSLQTGIYYTSSLTRYLMDKANDSPIVKKQLANPKVNVFTGKTFAQESKGLNSNSNLDFASMMTIDESKIKSAFTIDQSRLNIDMKKHFNMSNLDLSKVGPTAPDMSDLPMPDLSEVDFSNIDFSSAINMSKATTLMNQITADYVTYVSGGGTQSFSEYLNRPEVQEKINNGMENVVDNNKLQKLLEKAIGSYSTTYINNTLTPYMTRVMENYMQSYMKEISNAMASQLQVGMNSAMQELSTKLPTAMNINQAKFAEAFKLNMSQEELQALMVSFLSDETTSKNGNLVKLGYAEISKPYSIKIYPKDFKTKEKVIDILESYNKRMEKSGQDDKVIIYNDIVGTLMSSLSEIVDLISYVLIAFVSISLVVSSIMIGIITYISVLERKKEIGILRSIGASKGDISQVFNAETLIIGFSAGVLAIVSTLILSLIANAIVYSKFDVPNIALLPPIAGVLLVVVSMILTFVAGLIPSRAAAKKDPVEALRSE